MSKYVSFRREDMPKKMHVTWRTFLYNDECKLASSQI